MARHGSAVAIGVLLINFLLMSPATCRTLLDDPTPGLDNPKPSTAKPGINTKGFGSKPKFDWGPYTRPAPATPSAKADDVHDGSGRFPMGGRHLQQDSEEFTDGKAKGNSVPISKGLDETAVMSTSKDSPPTGRTCHTAGEHCSGDSQCCSKGCNMVTFRC